MNKQLYNSIRGSIYGFAIGDAMGATTEFMSELEIKHQYNILTDIIGGGAFNIEKGQVTDDTQMTLCVFKALEQSTQTNETDEEYKVEEAEFLNKCCKNFTDWYKSNPPDIGNCCRNIISKCMGLEYRSWIMSADNPESLGNGSLMRTMPLVLTEQSLRLTLLQGRLTHNNKICDKCIGNYYMILGDIINNTVNKDKVSSKYLEQPTGHIKNTLNNAIYWAFNTGNIEQSIIKPVNHGGDADTIAAITGSLSGAIHGYDKIPIRWLNQLHDSVKEQLEHYTEYTIKLLEQKDKHIEHME